MIVNPAHETCFMENFYPRPKGNISSIPLNIQEKMMWHSTPLFHAVWNSTKVSSIQESNNNIANIDLK